MNKLIRFMKDWRKQSGYFKWLMKYSKPYLPRILVMFLLSASAMGIGLAQAYVSKRIIDYATGGGIVKSAVVLYVMSIVLSIGISALSTLLSAVLDERFSFGIRKQLYEQIIHANWLDVTKYHTGDMMTRLTSDAGNIANGIIYTIPDILLLVIQLVVTFCMLYYYEPMLALLALCIAPVAAVTCMWLGRKLKYLQVKVQESEAAYRSFLQESMSNMLIVKAFANEDYSTEKLVELREERFRWVLKKNRMGVASTTIMSLAFQIGYIAAFTLGAYQVSTGNITFGTMTLFLTLIGRIQSPIMQLAQKIPSIVSILASAGRVIELQKIPVEEKKKTKIKNCDMVGVKISDLSFGYVQNENVIEDASIQIRPGEFVAIVGESGIGKTTLVRLIMSFMENNKGNIEFRNDHGAKESANAGCRDFISYVPQGNTLFSGTIRENVHMGRTDATEEEIVEALKMASAYEFIQELPNGIDTVIGEKGHGISEGQAQRVAIARALIRKAPFLILDEATSSLDEQTELAVLEGVRELTPKPTCLLITHRRSVLDYCDREIQIRDKKMYELNL